jgi:predicted acylesterase/phospholipase RssA
MAALDRRNLALTLAGGGNRAFYQLGLLHRWGERLLPRLGAIGCCSAGACVAVMWLSGREVPTRSFWHARRRHVTRNLEWSRMLRGKSPAPHGEIYRDTLLCAAAEGGLERLRAVPFPVLVLTAGFPRGLPATLGTVLGLAAYNLEKRLRPGMVHPSFGQRLGFVPLPFDARQCSSAEELADLVIASSSTPPFTPIGRYRGRALLDGGMIDNVPASVAEAAPGVLANLVMLTRPYPRNVLGEHRGRAGVRLYVAPTEQVPVERWDYTRPDLVDATIEMGEREAALHEPALRRLLAI